MRICGLNIPYEYQNYNKCASDRIHRTAFEVSSSAGLYNADDVAAELYWRAQDALGILRAVDAHTFVDIRGETIDSNTVRQELSTLGTDLATIVGVVGRTLASAWGKEHWSGVRVTSVEGTVISIPHELESLATLSGALQKASLTIA
ncbi:MAG: hypothetical protein JSS61_05540 [Verrucomicrobia bacterium]|nr:hypothetical protein [Verrucomicrobiota bacterium]